MPAVPEEMAALGSAPEQHLVLEALTAHLRGCLAAQVEDLKALRDLLLYHVEDLEDIMSALKSRHDFASCTLWGLPPPL